jgi:SAM-dependent methyltransferase
MFCKSRFRPLRWPADPLARAARAGLPNVPYAVKQGGFPFRLLRYWFVHQLVAAHASQRGVPCSVAEVGVDEGQQLAFASHAASTSHARWWFRWDAYDCAPRREMLAARGYTDVVTVDVDLAEADAAFAERGYDVVIVCHVLEHLRDPEAAVGRLARLLKPGGVMVGGGPVTPHLVHRLWERRLRRKARPFGHVSVLTPQRLEAMARAAGLEPEFHTGAFFMRRTGSALEAQAWWLRLNLAFGALFPGWPGEIYFAWRRRAFQTVSAPRTTTAASPRRPVFD